MNERPLKPGWSWVRLVDCCEEISERVDNPSQSGFERFVGLEHMQTREVSIRQWGSTADVTSAMKLFKAGDVLVARRNVYLERAAQVDFDGVCSGDAIVLRPMLSPCLPALLPFILNTDHFWAYASSQADGSMSKRISVNRLLAYEFALPSVDEQRRFLEMFLSIERCSETILEAKARLRLLRLSYEKECFHYANPEEKVGFRLLLNRGTLSLQTGPFGTVLKASSYTKTGYPIINPSDMVDGRIVKESCKLVSKQDWMRLAVYQLKIADMFIGRKGDMQNIVFVKPEYEGFLIGSDCIRFRVHDDSLQPQFLFYFLRADITRQWLQAQAYGTVMPGINEKLLAKMQIPLPIPRIQAKIIGNIEQIDNSEQLLGQKLENHQQLKRSFLHRIQSGEL